MAHPLHYTSNEDLRRSLHAGDNLRIATVDGRTVKIEVVSVTDTEIVGTSDSIPLEHVERIDRLDFSSTTAWTYVGAAVGTIAAIFLIVLFV